MYEMYIDSNGLMSERMARMMAKWISTYAHTTDAGRLIADDLAKVRRVIGELSRELGEAEDE